MSDHACRKFYRRSVAFALAGALWFQVSAGHAAPGPDHGASASGPATVIDGDTLDVNGTLVRLEGIDAPETGQTCGGGWLGRWQCGAAATRALARLVRNRPVSCTAQGHDAYGRMLGTCVVDGQDINQVLVRQGHAWAFVKYSRSYVAAEADARAEKAGIWQGPAEPAWDYRQKRWAGAEQQAPGGCAIKGNVTDRGQIYHMPWSSWYARVKVDEARGERWFCSESEAQAAGWRPSGAR